MGFSIQLTRNRQSNAPKELGHYRFFLAQKGLFFKIKLGFSQADEKPLGEDV